MSFMGGAPAADPMGFVGGDAAPPMGMDALSMGGGMPATGGAPAPAADPFAGVPVSTGMGKAIPEMTPLREWQNKHEEELEEINKKEQVSKSAFKKDAQAELDKWYQERNDTIEKKKTSNRKDEEVKAEATRAAEKPGANAWERVADLIDTNARTADEARDTSRMRALLIHLKTNPVVGA